MANNLPPEQTALDRKIVDELFEIVPEDWNAFVMSVEPASEGGVPAITILNPDVAEAEVEPSEVIRSNVGELVAFLAKEGRKWERLVYQAFVDPEGAWRLKIVAPIPD